MAITKPKTEFAAAINQICAERGIQPEVVLQTIQEAMSAAYKRDFGFKDGFEYESVVDPQTGETHIFAWEKEKKETTRKEVTPPGFGRIAAQVAKQVLLQKIREAEKSAILDEYAKRVGSWVNGMVLRFEGPNIIIDIGKGEGVMPPSEQVKGEKYTPNQRLVFLIKEIQETPRGRQIIVSRVDSQLVAALFRREVPEVGSGAVQIKNIARESGSRTKIAVLSTQTGVDPVGSCVGQKGVRVQRVIDELGGEKIDIIQYSEDPEKFIAAALSPAEKIKVEVDKKQKTAIVFAPEDQLSLVIGKGGQNVRLASELTGFKIEVKQEETSSKTKKEKNSQK